MLYSSLFLIRYFPFWAIPLALVLFELGLYHYNRRERVRVAAMMGSSVSLLVGSVFWIVFEGYWRAGPFIKRWFEQ